MNTEILVMINIILEISNKGTWTTLAPFCKDIQKVIPQSELNTAAHPQTLKQQ